MTMTTSVVLVDERTRACRVPPQVVRRGLASDSLARAWTNRPPPSSTRSGRPHDGLSGVHSVLGAPHVPKPNRRAGMHPTAESFARSSAVRHPLMLWSASARATR